MRLCAFLYLRGSFGQEGWLPLTHTYVQYFTHMDLSQTYDDDDDDDEFYVTTGSKAENRGNHAFCLVIMVIINHLILYHLIVVMYKVEKSC